ncbi:MAG: DUF3575 domain-containing protein [Bacteroidetes bacterium]|nr:DUF3575 domain-containing protein [Bacteroidota bacterium]
MLKHYPLAIFVLLICLCKADAQIIKANVLHPVFAGGASLAYEFKSDGNSTTSIYLSGGKKKDFIGIYDAYKFYNLTVEQRFYTTHKKARSQGFFVAPYAKFMYRNYFRQGVDAGIWFSRPDVELSGYSVGLGCAAGGQFAFTRHWLIDCFAGLGMSYYTQKEISYDNGSSGYPDVRLGVSLGYRVN